MKRVIILLFILFTIAVSFMRPTEIKFKGLAQTWFYYIEQNSSENNVYGFTLRRVRFKPYGSFSNSINWALQFGWDMQVARLLDAYLDFQIFRNLQLRIGQFTVPGSISSSLTSSGELDLIERCEITLKWGRDSGLSSYRAVGAQIHGKLIQNKLYYAFMIANPRTYGIFTPSLKETEYINENDGNALWGRIQATLLDGLTWGAFFGVGQEGTNEIKRSSYGVHLFFVKNGINLKMEYIYGQVIENEQKKIYKGLYFILGYRINKFEPIIRYNFYVPNQGDMDDYGVKKYKAFTMGFNYFHNKNIKGQVNYVIRNGSMAEGFDESIKSNIFYINLQFSF